jgi:hypothetical protein
MSARAVRRARTSRRPSRRGRVRPRRPWHGAARRSGRSVARHGSALRTRDGGGGRADRRRPPSTGSPQAAIASSRSASSHPFSGEQVLVTQRSLGVDALLEHALRHEPLEPLGQHLARDAEVARRGQVLQCNRHTLGVAAPAIPLFIWLTRTHTNRAASLEPAAQRTVRRAAANGQTADRLTVRGRRAEIKRCCAARPDPGPRPDPMRRRRSGRRGQPIRAGS